MKKYYWALAIFFVVIYIVPNLIMSCSSDIDNLLLAKVDGMVAILLIGGFTVFAIKKCTNDLTLALFSVLLFFSSFWSFSLLPPAEISTLGAWSSLTNFLALGSYFMASRENRFSVQRIMLLIFCGILTFGSLMINGFNPFFFSMVVATIYMLKQKRYLDMFLMATLISVITIILLFIESYTSNGTILGNAQRYFNIIINYWQDLFCSNSIQFDDILVNNIRLITIGIVPIIIFFYASYRGYRKQFKEIFSRDIYKFSLIFLICSIFFALLNKGLKVAQLPITYIPFSFLVATGLVNFLRMSNRLRSLRHIIAVAGVILIVTGINLALLQYFNLCIYQARVGISMIVSGLLMVSCLKFNREYVIAIYFLSFAIIVSALATACLN